MAGQLIISLDFELLWGVRDHVKKAYRTNILGARDAVPRILDLFAEHSICATWATVGFLFCENREELIHSLPDDRPNYENPKLSNYNYIYEVGRNESSDPFYFAPSLIDKIVQTPGQEIGTHTLSHYYCLERGQTTATFEADLIAAQKIAARRGIELSSIVFPRNQYAIEHLSICKRLGFSAYRGNPLGWAYRPTGSAEQSYARRAVRLIDSYTGVCGSQIFERDTAPIKNVPSSHFLRPYTNITSPLHSLHLANLMRGMRAAGENGAGYHLWWHPHNFGRNLDDNMNALRQLIQEFLKLREQFGMCSRTMGKM